MRRIFLPALTLLLLTSCNRTDDPYLITASGYVEATDVRLSAKVGGRVESVAVAEGDAIKAGTVVAKIETVDLALGRVRSRRRPARLRPVRGAARARLRHHEVAR